MKIIPPHLDPLLTEADSPFADLSERAKEIVTEAIRNYFGWTQEDLEMDDRIEIGIGG